MADSDIINKTASTPTNVHHDGRKRHGQAHEGIDDETMPHDENQQDDQRLDHHHEQPTRVVKGTKRTIVACVIAVLGVLLPGSLNRAIAISKIAQPGIIQGESVSYVSVGPEIRAFPIYSREFAGSSLASINASKVMGIVEGATLISYGRIPVLRIDDIIIISTDVAKLDIAGINGRKIISTSIAPKCIQLAAIDSNRRIINTATIVIDRVDKNVCRIDRGTDQSRNDIATDSQLSARILYRIDAAGINGGRDDSIPAIGTNRGISQGDNLQLRV